MAVLETPSSRKRRNDQAVAALEDVHQLVEAPALLGGLSGGGRLDEVVDAEVVLARVLEDGEALAAHVLLRGRDPQVGNGSHGLSTERSIRYFIGQMRYPERVLFPAADLFGQNARFSRTERRTRGATAMRVGSW